jgi:gliding motility-associated-like protein
MNKILHVISVVLLLSALSLNIKAQTQIVMNGTVTKQVTVPAGGCTYNWVNNNPAIGLPATGTGDIPAFTATNSGTKPIYATVTAYPLNAPLAYVPDASAKSIKIINTNTNIIVNTIQLDDSPNAIAISPDESKIYVTGGSKLYIISTSGQAVIDAINTGVTKGIVASHDGKRLYLAFTLGVDPAPKTSGIMTINVATKAIGRYYFDFDYDITLFSKIISTIYLSNDDTKLFAAFNVADISNPDPTKHFTLPGYVAVYSTFKGEPEAKIDVGRSPFGQTLSNDGKILYVASSSSNTIATINTLTNRVIDSINVDESPTGLAISPDGSRLYVTNQTKGNVAIVNIAAKQILNRAVAGSAPFGLSVTPDGSKVYVINETSNFITQINTAFATSINLNLGGRPFTPWLGNFIINPTGCSPVTINYVINPTPAAPTIVATGIPAPFTTIAGTPSKSQSFTVSSFKLTQGILVQPPPGFEVSKDNITFGPTVTIGTGGDIPETTVYIRLTGAAAGSYPGDILLKSSGATDVKVAVTGNVSPVSNKVPNQTVNNGQLTQLVILPGISCAYKWTSSLSNIGLKNDIGHVIPSFTAINTGIAPITATITASLVNDIENQAFVHVVNQLTGRTFEVSAPDYIVQYGYVTASEPYGIAVSADRKSIYISNRSSGSVILIKKTIMRLPGFPPSVDYKIMAQTAVGKYPEGLVISPDGSKVYVANAGDGTISVINTADNKVSATISLATLRPSGVAISPDGSRVYVSNNGSKSVTVIKTADNNIDRSYTVGTEPKGIAISPNGNIVYVANQGSNTVSVIDITTGIVNSIGVGTQPFGVAISPDGSRVYVSNQGSDNVSVINTSDNSIARTVSVGKKPSGIAVMTDGSGVYVANFDSDNVSLINTADYSVTNPISSDGGPFSFGNFADGTAGCAIGPFTFTITVNPTPKSIAATGTLYPVTTGFGIASPSTTFNVSGLSLTEGILVKPPTGFEVSTDSIHFSPTVTVGTGGNVPSTPVYIRLAATTPMGSYDGDITLSSAGATNVIVYMPVSTVTGPVPTITVSKATGNIFSCIGSPSINPNIMQFTVSAVNLNGVLTVAAPSGFEISLSADKDYHPSLDIFDADNLTIYVRSNPTAVGKLSGNVNIVSPGAVTMHVAVAGVAYALPTADPVASQTVVNGTNTTPIHFTGTGNTFNWSVDKPGIGLSATGVGDIAAFKAINNTNVAIIATITATPVSAALAYVTNFSANTLSVIDVSTNGPPIATIPVGTAPRGVVVTPDATRLYVVNYASNDVTVIDATTNTKITTIPVGLQPQGISMSIDGSLVKVHNVLDRTVSTISTLTNTVVSTVQADMYPPGTPITPDGKTAYVYDYFYFYFHIYDTATNTSTAHTPGTTSPQGLTISADGKTVYVSHDLNNKLYVIDIATNIITNTIDVGVFPQGVALSQDGKYLYVANGDQGTVSVINTVTYEVESALQVGAFPAAIGVTGGTSCGGIPVTCTITVKPTPPTITATGTPQAVNTLQGNPSPSTNFAVSGIKMQEGILVTPPNGFEVSLDNINFFPTIIVPGIGTIITTPVYIRLAASTAVGTYSGDIVLSSLNAESVKVPMPLSTVSEPTSSIVAGLVSGSIYSCSGTPSASPNIQQFIVSGYLLTTAITATAPAGFEISLNAASGYAVSIVIPQSGGNVGNTIIYIRSSASATGNITGSVSLTSAGATTRYGFVKASIGTTPMVNKVSDQTLSGGMPTQAINFTGTGNTYNWTNDLTTIGLAAKGSGNIPSFTTINPGGTQLVANVTVTPFSAAFAYVAMSNGQVNVINTASNTVVTSITIGNSTPYAVAASPDGAFVYVTNQLRGEIIVINTTTNTVSDRITVGNRPSGIVISQDGKKAYTANNGSNDVSIIDLATRYVTKINVGISPEGIALSPDGKTLYVANKASDNVSVINTDENKLVVNIPVGLTPQGLVVSPDGSRVYVTNYNSKSVSVINAITNTAILPAIPVDINPHGIAINPDGTKLYVGNTGSGTVSVINIATNVITKITVGGRPEGVSISPDGSLVYVAGTNSMSVINTITGALTTVPNLGQAYSYGNFITGGAGCAGDPQTFKIIVNPTAPYITATGTPNPLNTTYGTPSAVSSFSVSGISMKAGITVTPPAGYEVSLNQNNTFAGTVTFGAADVITSATIYIRLAANASAGTHPGDIILSSTGATDAKVPIDGTVTAVPLIITAQNAEKVSGATLTGGPGSKAFSYSGIQNLETIGSVTLSYGIGAEASAAIGTYTASVIASAATGGTFTLSNYIPTYLSGDIIVKAALSRDLVTIPNTFTPNGDGINDKWEIGYLLNYPNCTVLIFDRSGRQIFKSVGYRTAWNGTYNGQALPYGTYYYAIDLGNGSKPLSGYIALIR